MISNSLIEEILYDIKSMSPDIVREQYLENIKKSRIDEGTLLQFELLDMLGIRKGLTRGFRSIVGKHGDLHCSLYIQLNRGKQWQVSVGRLPESPNVGSMAQEDLFLFQKDIFFVEVARMPAPYIFRVEICHGHKLLYNFCWFARC